jgi:hypothetical protein
MIKIMSFNKLFRYILSLPLLLTLFPTKTLAVVDNAYFSTITFSIGSLPTENLTYSSSKVVGEYTYNLLRDKNIDFLTNDSYRRRTYNHYERVSVPPYSEVDVAYYWYNNTPDTVNVEQIRLPLSKGNPSEGDLTNILYDIGFEQGETCSATLCREGKYLDIDGVGLISSDMYKDRKRGVVIETLTVLPSVEITKYEIQYSEKALSKITLYVQNRTADPLTGVWITYSGTSSVALDFQPNETRGLELYKRCDFVDGVVNCGTMRIHDWNSQEHCMGFGSSWDDYLNPDSISILNKIGDEWIVGAQTQPTLDTFCIERIPYVYTTEELIVSLEPEEPEVTQEEYWRDLLDIDILPITSYEFNKLDKYLTLLKPLRIDNL